VALGRTAHPGMRGRVFRPKPRKGQASTQILGVARGVRGEGPVGRKKKRTEDRYLVELPSVGMNAFFKRKGGRRT